MSNTLRIELIANAAATARDLKQVAAAMNQVADAQKRLNASGGGGTASAGPIGGSPSGSGRGRAAATPGSRGPFTNLWNLNNQMGIPNRGTLAQAQQANLVHAQSVAQTRVNKIMGIGVPSPAFSAPKGTASFGQRLNTFIRSTRFGGGGAGGLSPLVGRAMDLFGGGGIGGAAGAAGAAIMGLAAACKIASDRLMDLAGARNFGGGSVASANKAARIGSIVGMSGTDMGQMAQSVMGNIADGGTAATYAMRYGVRAVPGMGDSSNKMDRFLNLVKGIAEDPNEEMARRTAQGLGMEQFLGLRDLSPETRQRIFKKMKDGPNQDDVKVAAEFNAQLKLIGDSFKNIAVKFAKPFIDILSSILGFISRIVDFVADNWNGGKHAMQPPQVARAIEEAEKSQKSAIDRNTDALNENTNAVKLQAGVHGGGERARNAVPAAWSNIEHQRRYMKAQAAAMGAFAF